MLDIQLTPLPSGMRTKPRRPPPSSSRTPPCLLSFGASCLVPLLPVTRLIPTHSSLIWHTSFPNLSRQLQCSFRFLFCEFPPVSQQFSPCTVNVYFSDSSRLRWTACVFIFLVLMPFIRSLESTNIFGTKDWLPEIKKWTYEKRKKPKQIHKYMS